MMKIFLIILGLTFANSAYALADFDILWEADTYTPPFYQGVALPSKGSSVKLVAIPNLYYGGKLLAPEKVDYRWEKNGNFLDTASGVGKQTLNFIAGVENNIRVTASTPNNLTKVTKTLNLKAVEPKINFYPVNEAGEANFKQNIKSPLTLTYKEFPLKAVPYYLVGGNDALPFYRWFYNGQPIATDPIEPSVKILSPPQIVTRENQAIVKVEAGTYQSQIRAVKDLIVKF